MKRVIFIPEVGRLVAAITVFVAFVSLAAAGSAQARAGSETEVSCGQTLKASVRLANDLVDCSANGLIIGANNITVDLNGHTIDGTNKDHGIDVQKHANVTIENGTITDFYFAGVDVFGARGVVLRKLTVRKIGAGCKQGDICAGIFLHQFDRDQDRRAVTVSNEVSGLPGQRDRCLRLARNDRREEPLRPKQRATASPCSSRRRAASSETSSTGTRRRAST